MVIPDTQIIAVFAAIGTAVYATVRVILNSYTKTVDVQRNIIQQHILKQTEVLTRLSELLMHHNNSVADHIKRIVSSQDKITETLDSLTKTVQSLIDYIIYQENNNENQKDTE